VFFHNSNFMRLFTLESLGPTCTQPCCTPLFGWDHRKPMSHGSKAFVYSINPIWTKRLDHVLLFNKTNFIKKKYGNLVALTFYSSLISFYFSLILILDFLFGFFFLSFSFCFFFSFLCLNNHKSWMRERRKILVAMAMYWCFLDWFNTCWSFKPGFKIWNGEVWIVCSHVWIYVQEKTNYLGF